MLFLTKILEKVVAEQLNEQLQINSLHDKFQSAYRTVFSTETALIKITDDILYALDNKSFTAIIMTDMSAAFDTVNHIILLNRLSKCFGITNNLQHILGLNKLYLSTVPEKLLWIF